MKEQVFIVDPYANGEFHQVINASVLIMSSITFETVYYIGQYSACDKMKGFVLEVDKTNQYKNIFFKPITYNFKFNSNGWGHIAKLLYCSWVTIYYYIKIPKGATLIINQNIVTVLHFLNFLSKFKKNKVVVFCHSELEIICSPKTNLAKSQILISWLLDSFFKKTKISAHIKFVLLGDYMKETFCNNIASYNSTAIFSIDHPYLKAPIIDNYSLSALYKDKIKIGIPGLINQNRGLNETKKLLESINIDVSNVQLFALSRVVSDIDLEKIGLIYLNNSKGLLPVDEYSNYVKQMDYILVMYSVGSYKLTASGAVLEALWWQKPIIALKNDYLVYLFKKYGDMGILCESIEEVIFAIKDIDNVLARNLQLYQHNLLNARIELLPTNIQKTLIKKNIF